MALTQKMYLGGVPVIQNYFGENPIAIAGAYELAPLNVQILIVGGGAGGGAGEGESQPFTRGGGGGAGRFVTGSLTISAGSTWNTTVGGAGLGATSIRTQGANGVESTLIANGTTYTAPGGGGGGGGRALTLALRSGKAGGSGGGAGATGTSQTANGGAAVNGSPIIGQGEAGISNTNPSGEDGKAGGGAGYTWIDGIAYSYGGASNNGANSTYFGGGGDGNDGNGGNGKGGMVRIAYPGSTVLASGGTTYSVNGYIVHYYDTAGSGSFTYPR